MKQAACLFMFLLILLASACIPSPAQPTQKFTPVPSATPSRNEPAAAASIPDVTAVAPSATTTFSADETGSVFPTDPNTKRTSVPGLSNFTKFAWYRGNSPDMKWVWIVEEEPGKDYFITHIVSADGKAEWFLHPETGNTGWQQATYLPYFWLPKEPYVYLVGRGCCARGSNTHYMERSLIRFNLETGQISMVLPWNMGKGSYSVGFSPGATYLRWTAQGEHGVHIMGLSSGRETVVTFSDQYTDIGGEYDKPQEGWSPDEKKFIQEMYIGCQPASNAYCFRVAFAVIEAATGHFQVINNEMTRSIDAENRWDYKIAWVDDQHIRLSVSGNQSIVDVEIPEN